MSLQSVFAWWFFVHARLAINTDKIQVRGWVSCSEDMQSTGIKVFVLSSALQQGQAPLSIGFGLSSNTRDFPEGIEEVGSTSPSSSFN
jgi:hypothetical protein